jgi:hypothetical protein
MRIPEKILSSNNKNDLEKIFHYTNFELNVGNYIFPAKEL